MKPLTAEAIETPSAPLSAEMLLAIETEAGSVLESPRSWRRIVIGLVRNPSSLLGLVLIVFYVVVALAAPALAPCPLEDPVLSRRCKTDSYQIPRYGYFREPSPPSDVHPFGTTSDQYDIYYGVIWGTRTAFRVGLVITAMALLIGLTVGSIAGYYGGWIDESLMRIVEIFQAFPYLLAAITLAAILGRGVVPTMIALTVFGWTGYARLVRSDILSVKQREYVQAARSLGASDARIILRHVLPNSIFPVLVLASLEIGTAVLSFAALSFFGLGVPDGFADWGQMISNSRNKIFNLDEYWYIVVFPGMAIVFFSLAWNLIGDTFRDLLDPRLVAGKQ